MASSQAACASHCAAASLSTPKCATAAALGLPLLLSSTPLEMQLVQILTTAVGALARAADSPAVHHHAAFRAFWVLISHQHCCGMHPPCFCWPWRCRSVAPVHQVQCPSPPVSPRVSLSLFSGNLIYLLQLHICTMPQHVRKHHMLNTRYRCRQHPSAARPFQVPPAAAILYPAPPHAHFLSQLDADSGVSGRCGTRSLALRQRKRHTSEFGGAGCIALLAAAAAPACWCCTLFGSRR